jgi:hypothetical protein
MLRAHEELESAKSKSEGNDVITVQGEIEPEDSIEAQLRHQSTRLDTIEEKVENLRKRWRRDFWTLVFVGTAIWAFAHFGWAKKLETRLAKVKTEVSKMLPAATQEAGDTAGAKGMDADAPPEPPAAEAAPAEVPPKVTPPNASNSAPPPQPKKERPNRPKKAKNEGRPL